MGQATCASLSNLSWSIAPASVRGPKHNPNSSISSKSSTTASADTPPLEVFLPPLSKPKITNYQTSFLCTFYRSNPSRGKDSETLWLMGGGWESSRRNRQNVADNSERSPLSAKGAKSGNSPLNPLFKADQVKSDLLVGRRRPTNGSKGQSRFLIGFPGFFLASIHLQDPSWSNDQ